MLSAILMPIVRLILPVVLGGFADVLIQWVTNMQCPAGAQTIFCTQIWSHVVAMVVTAITYLRTHPNGLNGGPAPDKVSTALAKVKLAPVPPQQEVGETGYKDPMLP